MLSAVGQKNFNMVNRLQTTGTKKVTPEESGPVDVGLTVSNFKTSWKESYAKIPSLEGAKTKEERLSIHMKQATAAMMLGSMSVMMQLTNSMGAFMPSHHCLDDCFAILNPQSKKESAPLNSFEGYLIR